MSDSNIYPVKPEIAEQAHIDLTAYQFLYEKSIADPESFWAEQAEQFLTWSGPWDKVLEFDYPSAHIRWFQNPKDRDYLDTYLQNNLAEANF